MPLPLQHRWGILLISEQTDDEADSSKVGRDAHFQAESMSLTNYHVRLLGQSPLVPRYGRCIEIVELARCYDTSEVFLDLLVENDG